MNVNPRRVRPGDVITVAHTVDEVLEESYAVTVYHPSIRKVLIPFSAAESHEPAPRLQCRSLYAYNGCLRQCVGVQDHVGEQHGATGHAWSDGGQYGRLA